MSRNEQLEHLQNLLENLPESIPYHEAGSTSYSFCITNDEIKEYGDVTSAVNHRLEVTFGSRRDTGGIVPIQERGPGVCAVVSSIAECAPADARIGLWIENLCSSAEKLYTEAGEVVSMFLLHYCDAAYMVCSPPKG